jgi:NADPH-dependent glutamate synthase beta subunit-like oxidoreductase/NAD(P)H-flavin reductase
MKLTLKGFTFQELFHSAGLEGLDQLFLRQLAASEPELRLLLDHYRAGKLTDAVHVSELILALAPIFEAFIADLFGIEKELAAVQAEWLSHSPVLLFKEQFILKRVKRQLKKIAEFDSFSDLHQWLLAELPEKNPADLELMIAQWGLSLLSDEGAHEETLARLMQWAVQALITAEGSNVTSAWVMFKLPNKLHFDHLVDLEVVSGDTLGRRAAPAAKLRQRDGFELTDQRMSAREVLSEIEYCVYCHDKEGDFCSKGFPVKKGQPELGLKRSPLNEILTGCPLEEKISEMHLLKKRGLAIAALATVMIDNPMCPATGHRICNDCMKACIYQKQDPVNIPEIETRVLTDVVNLPWGVEIYDLLTKWNPLRADQYCLKPYNGLKVLVMGMGPAGFALAHHLLMAGFAVVGVDGLKLEPVDEALIQQPIHSYQAIQESLADRIVTGFGGVAEYGITARWDKNFLKLILISLLRKQYFQCIGSIRFGGTLTVEQAWELGFDHLAVAVGAGLPKELVIPNSLAPGMRQANDFLMALQLSGAAKKKSLANLQIRLPAVVIGGGLTGVDAATELQAYYIVQVEKISVRYKELAEHYGEAALRGRFSKFELTVIDEYLQHATAIKQERDFATSENRGPDFIRLLLRWGGVTIVYRRSMQESPAYQRNHEELNKAMEEGIYYLEGLEPGKVILDQHGHCRAMECVVRMQDEEGVWLSTDDCQVIPARCILVATGARPNVAYEFEHRGTLLKKQFNYLRFDLVEDELKLNAEEVHVKSPAIGPFTSYNEGDHHVSFLGDTHPVFHGSVVKAIASAKRIYPHIVSSLAHKKLAANKADYSEFSSKICSDLRSSVTKVVRLNPYFTEIILHSPQVAKSLLPGQFVRLQSYESHAVTIKDTTLNTEALALIAIPHAEDSRYLSVIIKNTGVSRILATQLKPQQRVSLMGPTGVRTTVPASSAVLFVGGYLAVIQLLATGDVLKEQGNKIILFAQFSQEEEIFHRKRIESLCDHIVWLIPAAPEKLSLRPQDGLGRDDLIASIVNFSRQHAALLKEVTQLLLFTDADLICRFKSACHAQLAGLFHADIKMIAAVHGPMQCMLKGVCAQCLQWQVDPETGRRVKAVYACSWQNQPLELVDSINLNERLAQNQVQERFSSLWLDYIIDNSALSAGIEVDQKIE